MTGPALVALLAAQRQSRLGERFAHETDAEGCAFRCRTCHTLVGCTGDHDWPGLLSPQTRDCPHDRGLEKARGTPARPDMRPWQERA